MAAQVFPTPLILLAMGIFYLWAYVRRVSDNAPLTQTITPSPVTP